jgi:hypothetical protein
MASIHEPAEELRDEKADHAQLRRSMAKGVSRRELA